MKRTIPRLVIADPSLVDERGHHFSLTLQISKGARELGIETIWFTNKSFKVDKLPEYISVEPVFSLTMYDRYKPELKGNLPENKEKILLSELKNGIYKKNLARDDHILFHTAFGDVYRALPLFLESRTVDNLPYLHLSTPYEPKIMPGRDSGDNIIDILHTVKASNYTDKKVFFWAETPQLAADYTVTYGFNVRALVLPPPATDISLCTETHDEVYVALYLGAAREEKGFLHLPKLVEGLYESHGKTGKLKFIIQCTPQIIGYMPSIQSAIDKLSKYPESYVTLVKDVLTEKDYNHYLLKSNALMLLYDQKNYRIRGSGIAVEAISSDKCILTFKNTFCESLIKYGGGESVNSPNEAIGRLMYMVDNKDYYSQQARVQGKEYREINCVRNYIERVISQPNSRFMPNFLPSSLIGKINKPLLKI